MKQLLQFLVFTLLVVSSLQAQVGIGNTDPKATLDITVADPNNPLNTDGILVPRVNTLTFTGLSADQDGMLVFYTGTGASGKGFYYWNSTPPNWIFLSSGGKNTLDQAYDEGGAGAGRTITADNGAVNIDGGDTSLRISGSLGGSGKTGVLATYTSAQNQSIIGIDQSISNTANGTFNANYGIRNSFQNVQTTTSGISNTFGNYNLPSGRLLFGVRNYYSGGDFSFAYGFLNTLAPAFTTNGNYIGYGNTIQSPGTGNRTGFEATISGNGIGTKYGINININSGAGGLHYGIYSDVQKSSSYAAYLIGRTSLGTGTTNRYLMPTIAGTNNQIMAIDAIGQVNFVDGSSVFTNTDNQNISGSGLSGTDLTIGIQNGTSQVVDLSTLQDGIGTDNQTIDTFSFNTSNNELTLEIENDGIAAQTVDLTSLNQGNTLDEAYDQGGLGAGRTITADNGAVQIISNTNNSAALNLESLANDYTSLLIESLGEGDNHGIIVDATQFLGSITAASFNATSILGSGPTTAIEAIATSIGNEVKGVKVDVSGGTNLNFGIESVATGTNNWAGYFGDGVHNSNTGNVFVNDQLVTEGTFKYRPGGFPVTSGLILVTAAADGLVGLADPTTLFTNTDNQNISGSGLSGTDLTIGIQNGTSEVVDLSSLANDNDWHEEGSSTAPNNITDDMFHLGNVGIGKNTATYKLDVETLVDSRAINTRIGGTTTGTIYGQYILNDNSEDGDHYGINNNLTGSGDGEHHGIKNSISSGDGVHYGIANHLYGDGDGMHFGIANHLYGTGDGLRYGVYNDISSNGTQDKTGVYNRISLNLGSINADAYGVQNRLNEAITGSIGDFYGIHNTAIDDGDGARYGMYNNFSGSGDGERYGSRSNISGSGTGAKYGSYNSISVTSGGTHYGVYSNATKVSGYAGYFLGRLSVGTTTLNNYILPNSRGTNGQVMTTNGTGIVTWQTPTPGDITNVTAGAGITGGGNVGAVTLTAAANNGLNIDAGADRIQLGGPLTEDTTITYGTFDTRFNLNDTGDFIIQDNGTGKLVVLDNGDTVLGGDLYWRDENTGGTIIARLSDDGDDGRFRLNENGNTSIDLDANGASIFNEQGLDRDFRIESDDQVNMLLVDANNNRIGIGTGTPEATLHVTANSNSATPHIRVTETNATDGGRISFNNTVQTANYWTMYGRSRDIAADGRFNLYHSDAGNIMIAKGDGDVGFQGTPNTDLHVYHNDVAGSDGFKLQNQGANNNWWRMFTSNADGRLYLYSTLGGGSSRGNFNNNTGVYSATSDRRLKKDFKSLRFSWESFMQLETLSYLYKTQKDDTRSLGLIAQDVKLIYPELVNYNAQDDIYHMNYSGFGVVAIKAVQELKDEVDTLKTENAVLIAKLNQLETLEARILALENKTEITQVNELTNKE